MTQGEEYLALSVEDVVAILSRDELFVESEEQIFDVAMHWLQHDSDRKQYSAKFVHSFVGFVPPK